MSQAVMEKAGELGQLITQTEEFNAVKEKQSIMFKNGMALQLLKSYDELKRQQKEKLEKGEQLNAEDKQAMEAAEGKIAKNDSIQQFFEAQNKFQQLLNETIDLVVKACRE